MEWNQSGSVVQFTDGKWGVYCEVVADNPNNYDFGVSLLIACSFTRLFNLVKVDAKARSLLDSCLASPQLINLWLKESLGEYANRSNAKEVEIVFDLSKTAKNADKSIFASVQFTPDRLYFQPNFKSKGFGLLGKNIEFCSVGACLASAVFFINKDERTANLVYETIYSLNRQLSLHKKLTITNEIKIVLGVANDVISHLYNNKD